MTMIYRYVLPHHFLFQLAERAPVDMRSLLEMFSSVPPILRRRSKELLGVIKRAAKDTSINPLLSDTGSVPVPAAQKLSMTAVEAENVIVDKPPVTASDMLWSSGQFTSPWCWRLAE